MPLTISDEVLHAAGMDELEAKIEVACRWFDVGKLSFGHAARLADLNECDFDVELQQRGLPRFRYTDDMLDRDLEGLKKLGRW